MSDVTCILYLRKYEKPRKILGSETLIFFFFCLRLKLSSQIQPQQHVWCGFLYKILEWHQLQQHFTIFLLINAPSIRKMPQLTFVGKVAKFHQSWLKTTNMSYLLPNSCLKNVINRTYELQCPEGI